MTAAAHPASTTVVPTLRYRDVPKAVEWLCEAFGFEKHMVVAGEGGAVHYAQLTCGSGMVMLGPVQDSAFDKLMVQPDEIGFTETQICYFFVDDAKAHLARAKAAGAVIVFDLEDEAQGGRGYSCRDPEGHIWNFGTFNPWERQTVRGGAGARKTGQPKPRRGRLRTALVVSLWVAGTALGTAGALLFTPLGEALSELAHAAIAGTAPEPEPARDELAIERRAKDAAERALRDAREQLSRERSAKAGSEQAARDARQQLGQERAAREVAERMVGETREQLAQARAVVEAAERAAEVARGRLAELRATVEAARSAPQVPADQLKDALERLAEAQRSAHGAHEELEQARAAKEAAERTVLEAREQASKAQRAKEVAEKAAKDAQAQLVRERNARSAPPRRRPAYAPEATE
jgi:uncharacterized glyoxalase superfamily protein PhnB